MDTDMDTELDVWLEEEPWPIARGVSETEDSRTVFKNLLSIRPLYANLLNDYFDEFEFDLTNYGAMVKKFFGGKERE